VNRWVFVAAIVALVANQSVGSVRRTITVGKDTRVYYVHRPAKAPSLAPAVLVFHGGEGNGQRIASQTGFSAVADRNGFVVVYPEALDHWNDGRAETSKFGDDTAFVSALINDLVQRDGVDRSRVYATGASNGGMLTLRLACERSKEIAAFAAVAASFPVGYPARCKPSGPVPILLMHGTEDALIRWRGGTIPSGRLGGVGGSVVPVPDTLEFWLTHNQCSGIPNTTNLPDVANDGTTVSVLNYPECPPGGYVRYVKINGGGHTWPGGRAAPIGNLAGRVSRDIDAGQLIWEFFRDYKLPATR